VTVKHFEEVGMKSKDMKKILAGLGAAGLIGVGGFVAPGAHAASSG